MTEREKGALVKLFNRGGYILDISTPDFDALTMDAVGVAIVTKYRMSKGKSLIAYTNEASDEDICKLFVELMQYFENEYSQFESETQESENLFGGYVNQEGAYRQQYLKCKEILERYTTVDANEMIAKDTVQSFNSDYLNQQIKVMIKTQDTHPSDAIGKAKELLESCCKTILSDKGISYDKDDKIEQLANKAFNSIHVMPKDVPDNVPESKMLKEIYGNLKVMVKHIAEIRNSYGTGHGRESSYVGLDTRHACLIVGMSITLVNFLWASHKQSSTIN